jgi:serine/threonine-protein kinase
MLPPGTRLGRYEIARPLGEGGMGQVYLARDPKLDRSVAIKVLSPLLQRDSSAQARFEREVKAIAALKHANVLAIYDVGRDGEVAYAMRGSSSALKSRRNWNGFSAPS